MTTSEELHRIHEQNIPAMLGFEPEATEVVDEPPVDEPTEDEPEPDTEPEPEPEPLDDDDDGNDDTELP